MGKNIKIELSEISSGFRIANGKLYYPDILIGTINDVIARNPSATQSLLNSLYQFAYCKVGQPLSGHHTNHQDLSFFQLLRKANNTPVRIENVSQKREFYQDSTPFYFVFGQLKDALTPSFYCRFYFNLLPEGAPILIDILTSVFNTYLIPFQFKTLKYASHYGRFDSAVLYVSKNYCNVAYTILSHSIFPVIAEYLRAGVPLFTYELTQGVGFAESPVNGDSFGMNRCCIMADAVAQCLELGRNISEWPEIMMQLFVSYGISTEKPFLNPGSVYPYHFINSQITSLNESYV